MPSPPRGTQRATRSCCKDRRQLAASPIHDHGTQKLQLSPGCAAIYRLPEGTLEISREVWRALVHPDDLQRLDAVTHRALANRETEFVLEFRILLHGEVRWIKQHILKLYDEAGRAHSKDRRPGRRYRP